MSNVPVNLPEIWMLKPTTVYLDLESRNMCITGKLYVQTHYDTTARIFAKLTATRCNLYAKVPMNRRQTQYFITRKSHTFRLL